MVAPEGAGSGFRAIVQLSLIDWSSAEKPEIIRHRSPPCFGANAPTGTERRPDATAPGVRSDENSRGLLCWGTRQTTEVLSYRRVEKPPQRLNKPTRLRTEDGRKTARAAQDVAGDANIANFGTVTGVAVRHFHRRDVAGCHVGCHLCRARCMRNRTRRESGEECDKQQAGYELHERTLILV